MTQVGLQPVQALYLLWNQDLNGKATPPESAITGLAAMLRRAYAAVESQFTRVDDPDGNIATRLMALVYGSDATDFIHRPIIDAGAQIALLDASGDIDNALQATRGPHGGGGCDEQSDERGKERSP